MIREVNEQIHTLVTPFGTCDVICECSNGDCLRAIAISEEAYERVRRFPGRFIVVPGHEHVSYERVVEEHESYLVVEKIGSGATSAVRLDPRRRR